MPAGRHAPTGVGARRPRQVDEIVGAASFTLDVIDVEELERATL